MPEITLDIATAEGKTWLARITGLDTRFGFSREFVTSVDRQTSRSGRTGHAVYAVEPGVYESNEGRKRLGRRYWHVVGEEVREVDREEAMQLMRAGGKV